MNDLAKIYEKYQYREGHGDKGTAHSYIDEYHRLLEPYRTGSVLLEVGIAYCESLMMWYEYFNDSTIYGIDISDGGIKHLLNDTRFNVIIADGTKKEILDHFPDDLMFDIVIDDASHKLDDQVATFNIFKDRMNTGGIYIVEDVNKLDSVRGTFESLHTNCEIIDNRKIKNRYDDVLIVYRF